MRIIKWLAGLVGVICLVLGAAVAVYVGPASVVRLPERTVTHDGQLLVTAPQLLGYRDTTLRVTASTAAGPVFLGTAHPVDVTSYIAAQRALVIDRIEPTGTISGHTVGGSDAKKEAPLPAAPAKLDLWTAKANGDSPQTLAVPLTGDPVQLVVQTDPGATVTLGLGATVEGLFRLALVVATIGLLLLVGLVVLRRWQRPVERPGGYGEADEADASGFDTKPDPSVGSEQPAGLLRSRSVHRHRARLGVALVLAACVPALSGCLALPAAVPAEALRAKPALTAGETERMLQDYDRRNNAVIAGLVTKYDLHAWDRVDAGPVLARDRASTALDHELGKKREAIQLTHSPEQTWAPSQTEYPLWSIVSATTTVDPNPEKREPRRTLHLFTRDGVTTGWRMTLSVPIDDAPPAAPLPPADTTPTPTDLKQAVEVMTQVTGWLETGLGPSGLGSTSMKRLRGGMLHKPDWAASTSLACWPYLRHEDPKESLTAVRTSGGLLTMLTLKCQATAVAKKGQQVSWHEEHARALGAPNPASTKFIQNLLVTVAVEGTGTQVRVIGADAGLVRYADLELR